MHSLCFLLFATLFVLPISSQIDDSYYQIHADRYTYAGKTKVAGWPSLPLSDVISMDSIRLDSESFIALTSSGLFLYNVSGFTNVTAAFPGYFVGHSQRLLAITQSTLFLVNPNSLSLCTQGSVCKTIPTTGVLGQVYDVALDRGNLRVFLACDDGLYQVTLSPTFQFSKVPIAFPSTTVPQPFLHVAVDHAGNVATSTEDLLFRTLTAGDLTSFHFFRVPGIIDSTPTDMAFDKKGSLWIVNSLAINVQHANLAFERLGSKDGLPVNGLTSVTIDHVGGHIWIGSQAALVRYHPETKKWDYYSSQRFLPIASPYPNYQQHVYSVLSFSGPSSVIRRTVAVTDGGIVVMRMKWQTLQEKAEYLDIFLRRYFFETSPQPHPYAGFLAGGIDLRKFGDLSSWTPRSDDNNGLWTGLYLGGECLRYELTKDEQVRKNAWQYFEGIEFLNNVTGIKGLMARSVLYQSSHPKDGAKWYNSTVYPGWIWKGDTSSDEVTGHMFAYPLVYRYLAKTPNEKQRALNLMDRIMKYIINNNFYLIDFDGNITTWGRWNPVYLNDNPGWFDERGVNSAQILSWILTTYIATNDPFYIKPYTDLIKQARYDLNLINAKITIPSDDNYSDDELTYLPYFTYLFAKLFATKEQLDKIPDIDKYFNLGLERTQSQMFNYRPTPWNAIWYWFKKGDVPKEVVEQSVETLREWPIEVISWGTNNSQRIDLTYNTVSPNRGGSTDVLQLLPYYQRQHDRWNTDPYDIRPQTGGYSASDPGAYTFAFWLAKWSGLGSKK